ncbi:glycosyltransferase family 2 protein [Belnapia sp. T18]|uniref:Glycosyltransferase family 2 protein n=1 Tax=Belnapia arida TaxID=2804533 RepID=A0ABS1U498_9PROT|nr:glycosyltransferase family 2 protein [Belnapia arida]MBL6079505.1 glycosyltransferase family 2 protein [Belnapia arida]
MTSPEEVLPFGLRLVGPAPDPAPGEVIGIVVARNEALRLGAAIRHARRLGVGPILLIDNRSTDATRDIALRTPRVHVVEAPGSFADAGFGIDWVNALLDRHARGHWVMLFDADEMLVFPGSDVPGALPRLCRHLEGCGSEGLLTVMLDCFPREPLHAVHYEAEQELLEAAPWFEPPRLRQEPEPNCPYIATYGGIRERLFFPETIPTRPRRFLHQKLYNLGWRLPPLRRAAWFARLAPLRSPNLTKLPLLRWREGMEFRSAHAVAPLVLAAEQPSGVLLHFKFLQDFHARVLDAVTRNAHYDGSVEYRRYLAALKRDPDFTLHGPRSLRYKGPEQLRSLGLLHDTLAWAEDRAEAKLPATT